LGRNPGAKARPGGAAEDEEQDARPYEHLKRKENGTSVGEDVPEEAGRDGRRAGTGTLADEGRAEGGSDTYPQSAQAPLRMPLELASERRPGSVMHLHYRAK
jgi:hypothetical protein